MIELLRLTGFRSWSEFHAETDPVERQLLIESVAAWHEDREGAPL